MLHVSTDMVVQSARMSEIDRIMERLRAALVKANSGVAAIERIISTIEKARADLPRDIFESAIGGYAHQLNDAFPEGDAVTPEPQRVRGDLSPRDVANLARDTLLSVRKPLKRGQLVRELQKRDVPLAGTDRNKNLGTILWRHRAMFVSLPKLGYWARGVPLAGVYDPETYSESNALLEESPTRVQRPEKDGAQSE